MYISVCICMYVCIHTWVYTLVYLVIPLTYIFMFNVYSSYIFIRQVAKGAHELGGLYICA